MGYYLNQPNASQSSTGFWYEAEEGDGHKLVFPLVKRLIEADRIRRDNVLRLLRMCGNYSHTGLGRSQEMDPNRLRYNLMGQGVSTLEAEVTLNEPKATYIADGDWSQNQAARKKDLLIEAQMRESKWYSDVRPMMVRDALKTGTGVAYAYVDIMKVDVCCERVLPLELVLDDADALYGNPRSIHRRRLIDRNVLAKAWPEYADDILDPSKVQRFTSSDDDEWMVRDSKESDLVLVVQSWCLPSVHGADDGRYLVTVEGLDLHDCEYEHDSFPFIKLVYEKADTGWWGRSLAELLYPDQIELNRTLIKIQDSFGAAAGAWLVPRGAKVKLLHLTDVPGAVIEFNEGAGRPEYYAPQTVAGEMYMHADRIISRALSRVGINEMATAGQKPSGLDSGEAIRSYRDQFSMRQNPFAKEDESATVEMAKLFDRLNRDLLKQIEELTASKPDAEKKELRELPVFVMRGRKKVLKRMRWDEVDLPENRYVIQAYPTSSLPRHPAGRQATVVDWIKFGACSPEQGKRLLNIPDLEGELALDMVDHDFALFAFETMLEDGEYVTPEPFQNLEMGLELMRRAYLRARIDGAPESRLKLVRQHMKQIGRMLAKSKASILPKQPAMGAVDPMLAAQDPMMGADPALAPAPELAGVTEIPPPAIAA